MLKVLFFGMLKRTCDAYGDCLMRDLGLAPIALASPVQAAGPTETSRKFWEKECDARPYRIACLNYDS